MKHPLHWCAALALCLLTARLAPSSSDDDGPVAPVLVLLVRHAETASSTRGGGDPELSEAGRERALSLARLVSRAGVSHLYASEYVRTGATLAPTAAASELELVRISAGDPGAQLAALRALPPGSFAVVAGHSNTVPALVLGLGGEIADLEQHPQYGPMLAHDQYDRAFLVQLPAGDATAVSTLELALGD